MADNAAVNVCAAKKLIIPHVYWISHTLNLQINRLVKEDLQLRYVLEKVEQTVSYFRMKPTNRAALRNLTFINQITYSKERWLREIVDIGAVLRVP